MNKDLFGLDHISSSEMPKSNRKAFKGHHTLCNIHGKVDGKKCGDCIFFHTKVFAKTYFKCEKIDPNLSANAHTDHRKNWAACGLFKQEEK